MCAITKDTEPHDGQHVGSASRNETTVSFRFASVMVSNGSRVHPAASIQEYPCLSLDNKQTKQDEALGCRPL